MLRRLHAQQPASFAFTPANAAWADAQVKKYPEGRQASAVIALLWRAQEQEGWLSKPAIEAVARRLDMAYIRVLEVATFYFMFQLSPVGSVAHVQVCGTLSCMITGAEDLIAYCKHRIGEEPHHPDATGRLSWEEVECLGACANAPMAQIGKDYYEDLTVERLGAILDELEAGRVPTPGPQAGRFASEPAGGPTTLTDRTGEAVNASVELATSIGDTVKRIDGTEVPLRAPWLRTPQEEIPAVAPEEAAVPTPGADAPADETGHSIQQAPEGEGGRYVGKSVGDAEAPSYAPEPAASETGIVPPGGPEALSGPTAPAEATTAAPLVPDQPPATLTGPRDGRPDDLTAIAGIEPPLAALLNELGFFHLDQIAAWGPGEVAWVNSRLGAFRGGIERDDWIGQARRLLGR